MNTRNLPQPPVHIISSKFMKSVSSLAMDDSSHLTQFAYKRPNVAGSCWTCVAANANCSRELPGMFSSHETRGPESQSDLGICRRTPFHLYAAANYFRVQALTSLRKEVRRVRQPTSVAKDQASQTSLPHLPLWQSRSIGESCVISSSRTT